jgi:hypothetical protein
MQNKTQTAVTAQGAEAAIFDVHFNNSENGNSKGFRITYQEAMAYIKSADRSGSYWSDYIGGIVSIVNCETGETVAQFSI